MATSKKTAAKPVKKQKPSSGAKKAATPAKKVVAKKAAAKKAAPTKKAAPVKKTVATKPTPKAKPKTTATPKKAVAKKEIKNNKALKKSTDSKSKPAPAKKAATNTKKVAAPAKKTTAKKAAPAPKKAAPAPQKAVVAKKAAPAPPKKAAPAPKVAAKPEKKEAPKKVAAAPAAPASKPTRKESKKSAAKQPVKTVTTFAKTALPTVRSASATAKVMPSKQATVDTPARTNARDEKKSNVIIAHRKLENKAKQADSAGKTMINYQPEFTRSILDEPEQMTGPVYRYSDEELNEFRELITGRLESARKELGYLQGLITRKDEAGTEDTENRYANMEDGSGAMEREQLAQLASRQIQFINHLEKALIRIENKTYGICRVTGKLIDKARLRAVPHATLSIEAKKTMTK